MCGIEQVNTIQISGLIEEIQIKGHINTQNTQMKQVRSKKISECRDISKTTLKKVQKQFEHRLYFCLKNKRRQIEK